MISGKIPRLRDDIGISLFEEKGQEYILLYDKLGYATENISISVEFYEFLISIDNDTDYSDIGRIINSDNEDLINYLIESIELLDSMLFLESNSYFKIRDEKESEYLNSSIRPAVCSGSSYPDNKLELDEFLNNLWKTTDFETYKSNADAIIAPHIDLELKEESHQVYSSAYHSVRDKEFDLVIVFGTAHYYSTDLFMLTNKNYSTPLGTLETDSELLAEWEREFGSHLHFNEFAHKPEHSIEFQILLLQSYFKDRKFKVLPVLVGSFYPFVNQSVYPESNTKFNNLIDSLTKSIKNLNRRVLYVASVDFAHIGRKFGDDFDAEPLLQKLKIEDKYLIDSIINIDKHKFFDKIISDNDKYKICGTAPIYSLLSAGDFNHANFLRYNQWNEFNTKSAVSFASLSLYNK